MYSNPECRIERKVGQSKMESLTDVASEPLREGGRGGGEGQRIRGWKRKGVREQISEVMKWLHP